MTKHFGAMVGLLACLSAAPLLAADEKAPDNAAVAAPAATPAPAPSASSPVVKATGMLFADYYWVTSHHITTPIANNGLAFRRIWLGADADFGSGFTSRLRLEMASGDFASNSNSAWAAPSVKDAWLKYAYADKQAVSFGLIEGVVLSPVEKLWGLRSVEKTPCDLQGFENAREQGLSLTGDLGSTNYGFLLSNGANLLNQGNNSGKKLGLTVTQSLPAHLVVSVSGEYQDGFYGNDLPGYSYLLQAVLGYKSDALRAALQYDRAISVDNTRSIETYPKEIISAFVVAKVWGKASAYARIDHLPYGSVDKGKEAFLQLSTQRSTLSILGLDYAVVKGVNVQPNVEWVNYQNDNGGAVSQSECIPRVTVAYVF
jgi:hypothetical protein